MLGSNLLQVAKLPVTSYFFKETVTKLWISLSITIFHTTAILWIAKINKSTTTTVHTWILFTVMWVLITGWWLFEFLQETNSTWDRVNSDSFLNDACRQLFTLVKYPTVKQLFLQINTALPSSATVERSFTFGSQIFVPHRDRLSNLERPLLLRGNKRFL